MWFAGKLMKRMIPVTLFALLAACSSPGRINADPEALKSIHSIAVIRPPEVKTITIRTYGQSAAFWFGAAFGGLIGDAQDSAKERQLTEALNLHQLAINSILANDVAARLLERGFEAKVEDAQWEERGGNYFFSKVNSDADAVLVVTPIMVGFIAPGFVSNEYIPTIYAEATLLGRDRKTVLYRSFHSSGHKPGGNWKHTPAKVTFTDFDALMAHTGEAAASLKGATSAIASTIAADIKP